MTWLNFCAKYENTLQTHDIICNYVKKIEKKKMQRSFTHSFTRCHNRFDLDDWGCQFFFIRIMNKILWEHYIHIRINFSIMEDVLLLPYLMKDTPKSGDHRSNNHINGSSFIRCNFFCVSIEHVFIIMITS